MAFTKCCSICRKPSDSPVATGYWRWYPNGTESVGYRMYYGPGCWKQLATDIRLQLALDLTLEDGMECMLCGTKMTAGPEVAYLYLYPPKQERKELIVPTCGPCLDVVVHDVREHGVRLADRDDSLAREAVAEQWSFIPAA